MTNKFFKKMLFPNLKDTIFRFHIPVLISIIFTFLLVIKNSKLTFGLDIEPWVYFLLICGFFSYTSLNLFSENHKITTRQYVLLNVGLAVFLLYLGWSASTIAILLLLTGTLLILLIAPYIFNNIDESAYCSFNSKLFGNIFFTTLATLILCGGLSLALLSIHYLFDVYINDRLYINIWCIGIGFFGPFYALSAITHNYEPEEKNYSKTITFIISYILAPLIITYFGILYAYIIKILFEWNLPKGNVAYMVMAFGVIGIFIHVFLYPLKETGTKLIKLVHQYFYYALLAPTILLLVGIGVRINDYGVTENRYLIVLFAVWFLFSSVYFIATGKTKFKVIILTISLMLVLSSFGVWGVESVSNRSQLARLQSLLVKNQLIAEGFIKKSTTEINFEDNKSISSIVKYFRNANKLEQIKPLFNDKSYINTTKHKYPSIGKIMNDIGIPYISEYQKKIDKRINFDLSSYMTTTFINIKGFDYFNEIDSVYFSNSNWSRNLSTLNNELKIFIVSNTVLGVKHIGSNVLLEFDFTEMLDLFAKKGIINGEIPKTEKSLFVLTKETGGLKVRIFIKNISGDRKDNSLKINRAKFAIAVKFP